MNILTRFVTPALALFLTLAFGFWLSKVGKPYNGILFNVHKLVALGTVVVAAIQIYNMLKEMQAPSLLTILLVLLALCVVALFASGAFLSIGNLNYQTMLTIHKVAIALMLFSSLGGVYLLWRVSN